MNIKSALSLLDCLEVTLRNAKPIAESKGLVAYYQRDVEFIEEAKLCLSSGEPLKVRWVFDQMRNLSQGFGSYCPDLNALDAMLDRLYAALK